MFKLVLLLALVAVACATPVNYYASYYGAPAAYAAYSVPEKSAVAVSNANGNYAYSIHDQKAATYYAPVAPAVSYVHQPYVYTPYVYSG